MPGEARLSWASHFRPGEAGWTLRPPARHPLWAPTRTSTGPGKAGNPSVRARDALGGPCAQKPAGDSPRRSPAPRRPLSSSSPPTLREEVEQETEGATGRSEGSAGCGALRRPGDPTVAPARRGRARWRPPEAEPPHFGRPWRPSNLGPLLFREAGVKFCTQIDTCASPPGLGGVFP